MDWKIFIIWWAVLWLLPSVVFLRFVLCRPGLTPKTGSGFKKFKHHSFFLISTLNCGAKVCGLGSIESRTSSIKSFGFDESPCNPFWMSQNDFYPSNNFQKSLQMSVISINPVLFVSTCCKNGPLFKIFNQYSQKGHEFIDIRNYW